jgi:hypothetical protein
MPIDPSIPLQVKNVKLESPMNQLAMMGEAVKLGEMQRGVDTQNKLRELYSQGIDVGTPEGFKQVAALDPATALKLRADALQGQKLQGEIKKTGFELTEKGMGIMRERSKDLLQNPSNENYIAHIQEGLRDGLISPEQAKRSVQIYTAIPANERVAYITQGLAKAEKIFETKTISAAQQQADLTTRRGQDLTDTRAREGQKLQYGPDVVANTVTDAAGNVTQFNRQGEIIGKPGAVGKPSATFEKTAALQKQMGRDLTLAITELERVTKDGGLIDQSTGSGAGRAIDIGAGIIGKATPGAIAIAKLKPIADMALKMVPRFEGPQSDKDTASYKEAAGQLADASLPNEIRKEAGKEVLRLMKARKGQFVTEAMANEGINAGAPALPPGFTPDK